MNASQETKFHPTLCLWVIIQSQDAENAENDLTAIGVSATRLPSFGGFLGRRNATLLVALEEQQKAAALDVLQKTCRQRIEYITVPLESAPLPLPTPTPITIGGATIFTLEIEHYEEL